MTRTFLLALTLLVSAAWVQAQDQYPQTQSSQTEATASGHTTVEGCLQRADGNYTLTDKKGTTYQLQGATSKLEEHVGHEVQITGTAASEATSSSPTGTQTAGTQSALMVQSVKHISKTCKSAKSENY